jgi:hypothetical protein
VTRGVPNSVTCVISIGLTSECDQGVGGPPQCDMCGLMCGCVVRSRFGYRLRQTGAGQGRQPSISIMGSLLGLQHTIIIPLYYLLAHIGDMTRLNIMTPSYCPTGMGSGNLHHPSYNRASSRIITHHHAFSHITPLHTLLALMRPRTALMRAAPS